MNLSFTYLFGALGSVLLIAGNTADAQVWTPAEPMSLPAERHENGMAAANGKLYLIGGRGERGVDEYDPKTETWVPKAKPSLEMHHFQAVTYNNEIYILGGFTGGFPHEKPLTHIQIYNPVKDEWRTGPEIPADRLRGASGVFEYRNKIYLVCGIQDGHWDGHVTWFDEFDPKTNTWTKLPDAPRARDHFQVTVVDDKLYVAGGRRSSAKTKEFMNLTVGELDIYDFKTGKWTTVEPAQNLPTHRAGTTTIAFGKKVLVIGGESDKQEPAHREVEAFNPKTGKWETLMPLLQGRHGTQAVLLNGKVYIVAGSANRGGGPELNSMEILVR